MNLSVEFKKIHEDALMPYKATPNSVGLDIHARLISDTGRPNKMLVPPNNTRLVPTGLIAIAPPGHALLVCSRSGLAKDSSVFVTNAPGVIDPDYRGELMVLLYNGGVQSFYVEHEMRIAQLLCLPILPAQFMEVKNVNMNTLRGEKGFGSSGLKTVQKQGGFNA